MYGDGLRDSILGQVMSVLLFAFDMYGNAASLRGVDGLLLEANYDEALLENARADLARYEALLRQDSIAKQQVDTQAALVQQLQGQ